MAQPHMNHYPAAELGAGPEGWELGRLSPGRGTQPQEPSAAARSKLDQQRMLRAFRSIGLAAVRPAPPQAVTRAGAMDRISAVLASWRAAERELSELPETSPDRQRLRAVVERLRVIHHHLFAERRDDSSQL